MSDESYINGYRDGSDDYRADIEALRIKITEKDQRIAELENKLTVACDVLKKLSKDGEGTHGDRHASVYDCLPELQIEYSERKDIAREALKRINGGEG